MSDYDLDRATKIPGSVDFDRKVPPLTSALRSANRREGARRSSVTPRLVPIEGGSPHKRSQ